MNGIIAAVLLPQVPDPLTDRRSRLMTRRGEPFLRWQGSKRVQAPAIAAMIRRVPFDRYVEPFLGSGSVFFSLAPQSALLADRLDQLVETYVAVREDPVRISVDIRSLARSTDYYAVRSLDVQQLASSERAARLIYLNAHCFNGLYRTDRSGRFNVPRGTRAGSLPTCGALMAASHALYNATLDASDAFDVLQRCGPGDAVYLDPPFLSDRRSTHGEYGYHGFDRESWCRLLYTELPRLHSLGVVYFLSLPAALAADATGAGQGGVSASAPVTYRSGGNGKSRLTSEALVTNVISPAAQSA